MAGVTQSVRMSGPIDSDVRALVETTNRIVTDLETIRTALSSLLTKLDADAGVTDTDYASTLDVTENELVAGTLTDSMIGTEPGL